MKSNDSYRQRDEPSFFVEQVTQACFHFWRTLSSKLRVSGARAPNFSDHNIESQLLMHNGRKRGRDEGEQRNPGDQKHSPP